MSDEPIFCPYCAAAPEDHPSCDEPLCGCPCIPAGLTGDEEASELWGHIIEALTLQARGDPVPEELMVKVEQAAVVLAAATLANAGMSIDKLEQMFTERDYRVRLTYEGSSDEIGIAIDWEDGDTTAVQRNGVS